MSLVINNNLMALNANRNLQSTYNKLSVSTRRLSSGLRVNSAADDAAGLAIRELMRADIAALNQGVRNANDAISLIQTAEGSLQIIDEKLIRMKELAEQGATGTYDNVQRAMIASEFQMMVAEVDRIAQAANFNNIKLLDGSLSQLGIHFGPGNNAYDKYNIELEEATASKLGITGSIDSQADAADMLPIIDAAIISKDNIRAKLGAIQSRLEGTVTALQIQSENLQAAESRISDVDVAAEMTTYVKNQILAQTAVAMLAQANTLPQLALSLL